MLKLSCCPPCVHTHTPWTHTDTYQTHTHRHTHVHTGTQLHTPQIQTCTQAHTSRARTHHVHRTVALKMCVVFLKYKKSFTKGKLKGKIGNVPPKFPEVQIERKYSNCEFSSAIHLALGMTADIQKDANK